MVKRILIFVLLFSTVFSLSACDIPDEGAYKSEASQASEIQKNLIKNNPIPQITSSLERKNVAKRAEIFNQENKISYIYLTSFGKVMAFYTVKGKVSSLRSYMVPSEKLVDWKGRECGTIYMDSSSTCYSIEAPDIDGTYGDNVPGIFFFTTDGTYVEWNGEYMMSDQPLRISTAVELIREIK